MDWGQDRISGFPRIFRSTFWPGDVFGDPKECLFLREKRVLVGRQEQIPHQKVSDGPWHSYGGATLSKNLLSHAFLAISIFPENWKSSPSLFPWASPISLRASPIPLVGSCELLSASRQSGRPGTASYQSGSSL